MNINELKNELRSVDKDILKTIIVNKKPLNIKTEFKDYIENIYIKNFDKNFENKCINDVPLYNKLETKKINNFYYKVLKKGNHIYKAFPGFLGKKMEDKYLNSTNSNKPLWFANKYIPYSLSRINYTGMCAYLITEDIYLLDYFNKKNIINLIILINKLNDKVLKKKLIDHIKFQTSYNMKLSKMIDKFISMYDYDKLWIYTKPLYFEGTWHYCNTKFNKNFISPMGAYKGVKVTDELLVETILKNKLFFFEGIIRSQIQSVLDHNGIFYHEEIIIPIKYILKKIKRDINHPLDWMTWKIKNLIIPRDGILIERSMNVKGLVPKYQVPNKYFALFKFYLNNKYQHLNILDGNYIFSYNIHNFMNLNKDINNNIINIIKLLYKYNNYIKYLGLQEVYFDSDKIKNTFIKILKSLGYKNVILSLNGSKKKNVYILFASKYNFTYKIINLDNNYQHCSAIIASVNNISICLIHLSIGEKYPYIYDKKIYDEISYNNSLIRINELKKILDKNNIDIIFGDFNFTPDDKERLFLESKNFYMTTTKEPNTTPYNRVDMIFLNKDNNIKLKNNYTIKCNFSDHLPIMQKIIFT